MNGGRLKERTKTFALRIIELVNRLPRTMAAKIIGGQLVRCGTSVGANYRAACRARSTADFVAKMGIVEEEADEAIYWMELLVESKLAPKDDDMTELTDEAHQILAMTVSSIKTARQSKR